MDIRTLLFLIIVAIVGVAMLGILYRQIKFTVSAIIFALTLLIVYNVMPLPYKACIDLSLSLSGAEFFKDISEDNLKFINSVGVTVDYNSKITLAYPEFIHTYSGSKIDSKDITEFRIEYFSFDSDVVNIKIITTPKNSKKVDNILKELHIRTKK